MLLDVVNVAKAYRMPDFVQVEIGPEFGCTGRVTWGDEVGREVHRAPNDVWGEVAARGNVSIPT